MTLLEAKGCDYPKRLVYKGKNDYNDILEFMLGNEEFLKIGVDILRKEVPKLDLGKDYVEARKILEKEDVMNDIQEKFYDDQLIEKIAEKSPTSIYFKLFNENTSTTSLLKFQCKLDK